jgi:hydroxyacylglutathione hydrolase
MKGGEKMGLEIISLQLGPMENNTYLIADSITGTAAVIDPSFESEVVLKTAQERDWKLSAILLTHAHFDHVAGVETIASSFEPRLPVALHEADLELWRQAGGARLFGIEIDLGPEPQIVLSHGQVLDLGKETLEVRHTPGHSLGHSIFYSAASQVVFCGDLIFSRGVGRTDLPGGSHASLLQSIRSEIFTLPPETRLLSGHGPATTVREEMEENLFLR